MKEFAGKTAVVTGAACGIGKALARRCAQEKMNVVLADVEADKLQTLSVELETSGAIVLTAVTDVAKVEAVADLADRTLAQFGGVHLLFNNAGVGIVGPTIWENSLADWQWVLGVNLWGVIHGLHIFVPIMLAQETECHIVNTASAAGLLSPPGMAAYNVSKHGVVTLSETLHHELQTQKANISVSVFCPGVIKTDIHESARNRPDDLHNPNEQEVARQAKYGSEQEGIRQAVTQGMDPEVAVEIVFTAVSQNQFYIFSHQWVQTAVATRMEDILQNRPPTNPNV
ncbi:MAG: SDR family NAD(P)-dependent oxidoreductase [Anaerolineales bacterium]|nr:SDR family NAD(P)-dependent oxidoreductase [Anaerolineales bacterium]